MANPWAGEVALTIDGEPRVLKLTLGALAELEGELQADTLVSLIERFEGGQISTRDVLALIVAGLTEILNQPQGRVYQSPCSAVLGDHSCRFDLSGVGYSTEVLIETARRAVLAAPN